MANENTPDIWKELRKPFDPKVVGKLPRGGVSLDYVGHAAVTDRLLTVDPNWSWEPLALDERGLPAVDEHGNLWIRLTVGGVSRIGVGDGKNPKERIGDALRNAAMRFGVALDLWTKDELESHLEHPELKNEKPSAQASTPAARPLPEPSEDDSGELLATEQIAELMQLAKKKGYLTKEAATAFLDKEALMPFTKLRAAEFESFRKVVISAGWKKPDAVDAREADTGLFDEVTV